MPHQLDLFDQPIPNTVKRLTFNQAIRLFVEIYWSKKKMYETTKTSIKYLTRFFDGRFIETVGRLDIQNLKKHLAERKLGASGINKCHMILTVMYNRLEDWKEDGWAGGYNLSRVILPRRNPGSREPRLKEPAGGRFIVPWEFKKLHRFALKIGDFEIADFIRFGIWSRLSPIDLLNLNDDEIKDKGSDFRIEVRRRHTKTDKNPMGCLQVIPLAEKMWGLIERRRKFRNEGDKRIFIMKNKRRRIAKLRKYARENGMADFTIRDLRRSGSGYLHEKGISAEVRADGLGQTSTRICKSNYTPNTKPHLKKPTEMLVQAF